MIMTLSMLKDQIFRMWMQCLACLFIGEQHSESEEIATVNTIDFEQNLLDSNQVKLELSLDSFAKKIMHRVRSGNWTKCSQAENPFCKIADKVDY